jgi:hypothetical protein
MNRWTHFRLVTLLAVTALAGNLTSVHAGRTGGPASTYLYVPAYQTISLEVPFNVGAPAVVSIRGTGHSPMQVNLYDSDGNVAIGNGFWDRSSAYMDVYRAGTFRIEVVNMGQSDNIVLLTTN